MTTTTAAGTMFAAAFLFVTIVLPLIVGFVIWNHNGRPETGLARVERSGD